MIFKKCHRQFFELTDGFSEITMGTQKKVTKKKNLRILNNWIFHNIIDLFTNAK